MPPNLLLGPMRTPNSVAAPHGGHRFNDIQQKASPISDRATIRVRASIGVVLEELIDQITVGGMHLDAVEAGDLGSFRRFPVFVDKARYFRQLDCCGVDPMAGPPGSKARTSAWMADGAMGAWPFG